MASRQVSATDRELISAVQLVLNSDMTTDRTRYLIDTVLKTLVGSVVGVFVDHSDTDHAIICCRARAIASRNLGLRDTQVNVKGLPSNNNTQRCFSVLIVFGQTHVRKWVEKTLNGYYYLGIVEFRYIQESEDEDFSIYVECSYLYLMKQVTELVRGW